MLSLIYDKENNWEIVLGFNDLVTVSKIKDGLRT